MSLFVILCVVVLRFFHDAWDSDLDFDAAFDQETEVDITKVNTII